MHGQTESHTPPASVPWMISRTPPEFRVAGAALLADSPQIDAEIGAKRMIERAAEYGIDPSLMWHVALRANPAQLVGSCLVVPGVGRTATVFATPRVTPACPIEAISTCIRTASSQTLDTRPHQVVLFQTLIEPHQRDALDSFVHAGYEHITDLDYMTRPICRDDRQRASERVLKTDFVIRPMGMIVADERDRLLRSIDLSYDQTLDCPELSHARSTSDVLDSHIAAGAGDTSMWLLAELDGVPIGCCLVSKAPQDRIADLIYIGLAPHVRGVGLGRALVQRAIEQLAIRRIPSLRCAVDQRNLPARLLYESIGFARTESRCAMIGRPSVLAANSTHNTTCLPLSEAHKS